MTLNNCADLRWLSPDPLGGNIMDPQTFSRYAYALNNPATFNDPPGHGMVQQEWTLATGFTLIELLVVIAIFLIIASFAAPTYTSIVTRSHEVVLKDDLFTMRRMITQYTLDNHKPPESLEELVKSGYLSGGLPIDPFIGSNQTWQPDIEEVPISPEESLSGVVDVHSGSNARSLEGTPYSSSYAWLNGCAELESNWHGLFTFGEGE